MTIRGPLELVIKSPEATVVASVQVGDGDTLLVALCALADRDPRVSLRANCRTGQCGVCAVRVNGQPCLPCLEKVTPGSQYLVEPIMNTHLTSLVCDVSAAYLDFFSTFVAESEHDAKQAFERLLLTVSPSTFA